MPIAGKYRLIDIPISNCLNSGLRRMFVLTQFNSESLNKHISLTYKFDLFSSAFVSILAAEQTEEDPNWFQGTADAVRQSLRHLETHRWKEALILSGDQLYQMDYRKLMESHRRAGGGRDGGGDAGDRGPGPRLRHPEGEQAGPHRPLRREAAARSGWTASSPTCPASGRRSWPRWASTCSAATCSCARSATPKLVDFGRHIIPKLVPEARVHAYVYRGYWEDVGTIQSYFDANLALCQPVPPFDFYDSSRPVYSNPRFLPATKVEGCTIENALVAEGCVVVQSEIRHALIGIRARIGRGVRVTDSLILGADYYETVEEVQRAAATGLPPIGIGDDTVIRARDRGQERAHRPRGAHRSTRRACRRRTAPGYFIREGIVIVPKNAAIAGRHGGLARRELLASADRLDLVVAVGGDALAVAAVLLARSSRAASGSAAARALRAVHDLALGEAGLADLPRLRDGGALGSSVSGRSTTPSSLSFFCRRAMASS